jgi:urease accessory protein
LKFEERAVIDAEKFFHLIRLSDSFFPMGSFAMSQGMEQIVNENLFTKEQLDAAIDAYLKKIWESFDLQIFHSSLEAAEENDIETLTKLDEICHSSKIAEENRIGVVKMGHNMMNATDFEENSLGANYKDLVREDKAYGTYPVILAIVSNALNLGELGAISLLYVNSMEVTASLVRMGAIDYIEAQRIMERRAKDAKLKIVKLKDLHQSFPIVDISSMRHETTKIRMFIT